MKGAGFPADKDTIGISCLKTRLINSSVYGLTFIGMFNAKVLLVFSFVSRIIVSTCSGFIVPHPIVPRPPALDTAAARLALLIFPIPPCIIGYFIEKNSQICFTFNPPYLFNVILYLIEKQF